MAPPTAPTPTAAVAPQKLHAPPLTVERSSELSELKLLMICVVIKTTSFKIFFSLFSKAMIVL